MLNYLKVTVVLCKRLLKVCYKLPLYKRLARVCYKFENVEKIPCFTHGIFTFNPSKSGLKSHKSLSFTL